MAGLGTTVAIIEENVAPGEKITKELIVYNTDENQSMDISAKIYGMVQEPDGTANPISPNKDNYRYSARPFFNITPASFHLGPGAKENLTFEGVIPKDIVEGGRYAIIRLESAPLGSGTIGVALAIEIPVRLSIKGDDHIMTGNITDLEVADHISAKEPRIILKFNNTGNYHYKANAEVAIKGSDGSVISNVTKPLGFSTMIPLTMRLIQFNMTLAQELKKGSYILDAAVVREDKEILDTRKCDFTIK